MKVHVKKKIYRQMCKDKAKRGLVNAADGVWFQKPTAGNS